MTHCVPKGMRVKLDAGTGSPALDHSVYAIFRQGTIVSEPEVGEIGPVVVLTGAEIAP
jgi:hypothetical protein